ncbi:MAG: 50S ribosomal protein L5 [Parcubacteria group bacterium ADurb.Bin326]|nr:MAG: 50S ribosomal protein L5 [Parcubacteria group bacterium ADurb.Bin326]
MKSRFYKKYKEEVVPKLKEELGIKNIMAIPKIQKVVLNVGINSRNTDSNLLENVESTLERITGQKPVRTKAKKAISAFKVKENMVVGVAVTIRGERMYDFLDKLVNISLSRIRDFRGVSDKCVDKQGNMTIGFKEHTVFPEIKPDEIDRIHGLQITVTTNAGTRERGLAMFRLLGFPFQKK